MKVGCGGKKIFLKLAEIKNQKLHIFLQIMKKWAHIATL